VYFNRALSINPKDTSVLNNKGTALLNIGSSSQAIGYFNTALELEPNNFLAIYNKGLALAALGNYTS
jgi:Flp pilus assembly protein TadD